MRTIFIIIICLYSSFSLALPENIKLDAYLESLKVNVTSEAWEKAAIDIERIESLSQVKPPTIYHYYKAEVEFKNNSYSDAQQSAEKYLSIAGKKGRMYAKALLIYSEAEAKIIKLKTKKIQGGEIYEDKMYLEAIPAQTASPKMVFIPAGSFQMGCVSGQSCQDDEKPVHRVSISAFKMSETEVTFANWDACVAGGGCSHRPDDKGWGRGNRPVMNVSYEDITQQFIPWLNKVTGSTYRLPSEAEWEYAARAGSTTKYSWGNSISSGRANCEDCGSRWDNSQTAPVKSFSPNGFGLYDMHGNVWEWVQDCWNESYSGAPTNGAAWERGDCWGRVMRGGSWFSHPNSLRSANRNWFSASDRSFDYGFRLVQGR